LALAVPLSRFTPRVGGGSAFYVRLLAPHFMKTKIGVGLVAVSLLSAIVLQVVGSPAFGHVSKMTKQGDHVTVDNFYQIRWYAFVLAGLLVAGIVLAILPSRKKGSSL
jgi:hypothetical protein